ncbi:MAG: NAD(P)-dependent alcohol dehydrogenase [Acidobacteria bacterium]|nr:MAG: NAD(P)-dependent alcohol dehydrogenase [Acidobacteriota bacterium]
MLSTWRISMAVKYQIEQFGAGNLSRRDFTPGPLQPDKVRVQIKAISLNYRDLLMIQGHYNPKMKLPVIPISDGAGVVTECGSLVTQFEKGDRVLTTMIPGWEKGLPEKGIHSSTLGGPADGCLSEVCDFYPRELLNIPANITFEQAATLPVAGLTAWNAIQKLPHKSGKSILLLGTGGVSLAALGIAKAHHMKVAITSSSNHKLERAQALGADCGLNYVDEVKWGQAIRSFFPDGCDLVVEVGGSGTFNQSVTACRLGGKIALIGVLAETGQRINLTKVLMSSIDVHGILVGSREQFKDYLRFVEQTGVTPTIGQQFEGIDQIANALELLQSGQHFGKIVISF